MKKQNPTSKKTNRPLILADVAARAGVAVSTVSRVVNGSAVVAAEKRKQIEAIIKEMGYKPAPLEKRKGVRKDPSPWINHKAFKIVLYGPCDLIWITNYAPVYSYVLHGIEEQLHALGLQRIIERVETEEGLMRMFRKGGADGYLILKTWTDPLPEFVCNYPVVTFMGRHEHLACDQVTGDPARAGMLAAEYLHQQQCTFGIAVGSGESIHRKRAEAFSEWFGARGIQTAQITDSNIVRGREQVHQANREMITERLLPMLLNQEKPIGIFSMADIVTTSLYSVLNEAGYKIGRDVFVVSCNNERPFLDALHPAPAVVDVNAEFIGRRAVQLMVHRLEFPRDPRETVQINPELILPE